MVQISRFSLPVFALLAFFSDGLFAQSNFDLQPPIQADVNSGEIQHSPDPSGLGTYQFGTMEIDENGKVTIMTMSATQNLLAPSPGLENPSLNPKGVPYTERVQQTYTVMVPYTENVNGNPVTKMRAETRTRLVNVTRFRKRNEKEQAEFEKKLAEAKAKGEDKPTMEPAKLQVRDVKYRVTVPYTEMVDGQPQNKTRTEVRTRKIQVLTGKTETKPKLNKAPTSLDQLKCFDLDGKPIDQGIVKERILERTPIILINSPKAIAPYFKAILKPDAMFVVRE